MLQTATKLTNEILNQTILICDFHLNLKKFICDFKDMPTSKSKHFSARNHYCQNGLRVL